MKHIQLRTYVIVRLLNKLYGNEVTLRVQNQSYKLASWFLVYFFKRFRSFNTANIESVSQKAEKLLSIKIWKWFDPGPAHTFAFKSLWPVFFAFDL